MRRLPAVLAIGLVVYAASAWFLGPPVEPHLGGPGPGWYVIEGDSSGADQIRDATPPPA